MPLPFLLPPLVGGLLGMYGAHKLNANEDQQKRQSLLGSAPAYPDPVGPPQPNGTMPARENVMYPGTGLLGQYPQQQGLLQGLETPQLQQFAASLLSPQQQTEPAAIQVARILADPNTSPELKNSLLPWMQRGTSVTTNVGTGIKAESGYMVTPQGDAVVPIPGGTRDQSSAGFRWTEGEMMAGGYAARMTKADAIMSDLVSKGFEPASTLEHGRANIPLIGNFTASPEFQQFRQAQEDWVRAKLRKESGAVIADEEMAREITTYFPQPGDSQKVIDQKAQARQTATSGLIQSSGGYFHRRLMGDSDVPTGSRSNFVSPAPPPGYTEKVN